MHVYSLLVNDFTVEAKNFFYMNLFLPLFIINRKQRRYVNKSM